MDELLYFPRVLSPIITRGDGCGLLIFFLFFSSSSSSFLFDSIETRREKVDAINAEREQAARSRAELHLPGFKSLFAACSVPPSMVLEKLTIERRTVVIGSVYVNIVYPSECPRCW